MSPQPLARPLLRPFLRPLVPLYRLALGMRELRLGRGWERVERLERPVISIGNISAGGAGKTPLTIALARALTRRGIAVDVLSRGYGRRSKLAARVDPTGAAEEFGDEPLLIARAAGVPVFVARQRVEAGRLVETAEANASRQGTTSVVPQMPQNKNRASAPEGTDGAQGLKPPVLVGSGNGTTEVMPCYKASAIEDTPRFALHLLDDGFQHRQLARDVDIVLVNHADLADALLPAGNLREPLASLQRATVLAIPAEEPETASALRAMGFAGPIWRIRRRMEVPTINGPVIAFCGIARPAQFFSGLEQAGLELAVRKVYADHHRYTAAELLQLASAALTTRATLVTTEKDAVRLAPLLHLLPPAVELQTAVLVSEIEDEDAALDWLLTHFEPGRTGISCAPPGR
jgi:tetraacyldisaccharide 4'-kinase